jgi:hypothetical protein
MDCDDEGNDLKPEKPPIEITSEPDDDEERDHLWTEMTTVGWVSDMITDFQVMDGSDG